jgi:hypothetical protein
MSEEAWYCVDSGLRIGPISLQSLNETLATLPDAKNVLVWCEGFQDWKIVGDVKELRARRLTPPPVPKTHLAAPMPTWRVRWWWYPVALCFFGSIGNRYGREAMAWITADRQTARMIKRKRRQQDLGRVLIKRECQLWRPSGSASRCAVVSQRSYSGPRPSVADHHIA